MLDGTTRTLGTSLDGSWHVEPTDYAHTVAPTAGVQPGPPVGVASASPQLWTSLDFVLAHNARYVVKGLLAPGDVGAILGQPGAGKSTLAPHLGYAVAQGYPFFGRRTGKGRVLYLAAEDEAGVKRRLFALGMAHGHTPDCAVMLVNNLRDPAGVAAVMEAVVAFTPSMVILDTMPAAFSGMDENASGDMGQVVAFSRCVASTGAAVLLVAHPAKAADGGSATARGHGSLNGTLDMALVLTADDVTDVDALVRGTLAKNRNGNTAWRIAFRKNVIVLGQDEEGDSITTTLPVEVNDCAAVSEIDLSTISNVQEIVAGGNYRRDWQSPDWLGNAIGAELGYKTPILKSDRKEVEAKIAKLISDHWLVVIDGLDSSRKPRKFVAVGAKVNIPIMPTVGQPSIASLLHPAPPMERR